MNLPSLSLAVIIHLLYFLKEKQQIEITIVNFLLFPEGFTPPIIVCASALGLENGKIPDTAIVASSRYNQYWGPERGRLNEKKDGNHF